MARELKVKIENDMLEISRLCAQCEEFLEINEMSPAAIYTSTLAIEELVTNIIKYGYDDMSSHEITVDLSLNEGKLTIMMEDDGHEFDPLQVPAPVKDQPLADRRIGGLGIHLVRNMAESLEYRRENGRNIQTVHIRT